MAMRTTLVVGVIGFLALLACDGNAEGDAERESGALAALPRPAPAT